MSDSILDRILSRREDQEKEAFDAVESVAQMLKLLPTKEADILRRRYGLREEDAETLEHIGQVYQVTRERIRQIERQAVDELKKQLHQDNHLEAAERLIVSVLHTHGGIVSEEEMYELLLGLSKDMPTYQRSLSFLLQHVYDDVVEYVASSALLRASWKVHATSLASVERAVEQLQALCEHSGVPFTFDGIIDAFSQTALYQEHPDLYTPTVLASLLRISKHIGKNPFDEYGLVSWGSIAPKRMNDRVYMVLKKEGKPMHFEEIAHRVSKIFKKKAYPPTVHNELILNSEYVLVGRGMYALKEWGYTEGVVSEVIKDILHETKRPMKKQEIIDAVLAQRMVKKNTILLALSDKTLFHKNRDGLYTVAVSSEANA